jgi:hypothetical protein
MPKSWRSMDTTIGPYSKDGCKAIRRIDWKEDNAPIYFMIYRCKDKEVTAKMWLKDDTLNAQYIWK